ncbi:MAG: 50S ribosomal protein L11 methyltransferase [Acidobacteriota bacterium]|nr:50S ribosomal protein L11 methyltransferase [Acidobacteriota bacterium]
MLRLALRVRRADAELVLAELLELAPGGVEELDVDGDTVEYAVYGAPGELPELPDLRAAAGAALLDVRTSDVADDWAERWREFHRPLVLGERLSVRPPWEPAPGTALDLVIDPGRAFGTGAHATTRACLELLLDLPVPVAADPLNAARPAAGGPLATGCAEAPGAVDLGCGSGVLAIAAAKLGWPAVLALDHDQPAVGATLANAAVNGVALQAVRRFDLRVQRVPATGLVLANLLGPLLLHWAAQLRAAGREHPRRIIASGLLVGEADGIAAAFAACGYGEARRLARGDWAALLLELPAAGSGPGVS